MNFAKSSFGSWLITASILTSSALAQDPYGGEGSISPVPTPNICPPPLIARRAEFGEYTSQNCFNDCCLACPFSDNFYEKYKIRNTFQSFAILGIISFFLMIILAIFFVTLPSYKRNPLAKVILLPLALSVMYFEGSEFFTVNQESQCINPITPANRSSNRCVAQAFFTLGGGYAIACYAALLMTHLHLISVWRVEFIERNIAKFHFLIVGYSLAAFIIPYVTNNIQSSNICFISLDAAPAYFYLLSFIYIAFAAHLSTFIYMAHITIKSNRRYSTVSAGVSIMEAQRHLIHIKTIFKVQWRALSGAILMLLMYVLNWHFYVFDLRTLTGSALTSDWVVTWVACLQRTQGDQNTCADEIGHVNGLPRYSYIFVLLFFNRVAGILIFIIFAAKKSLLLEAYDLIRRKNFTRNNTSSLAGTISSEIRVNGGSNALVKYNNNRNTLNSTSRMEETYIKRSGSIRFTQNLPTRNSVLSNKDILDYPSEKNSVSLQTLSTLSSESDFSYSVRTSVSLQTETSNDDDSSIV